MRKIMIISLLSLSVLLTACGNKLSVIDGNTDFGEIEEVVAGTDKTIDTNEVISSDLSGKIKQINPLAVVEESLNPGLKMVKIELPINEEPDDKAEEFFDEVEEIVNKCNFKNSSDYDFYYFSTSKDGAVEITAAFKRLDGKFILESVNGIGELYKNAPEIAAGESELFR